MNPTPGDVHVNAVLTNISIAMIQSAANFVADSVFPNIPVSKQSDVYYSYDRGEFNRDEMGERAPGAETEGGGYKVSADGIYYARVYGFHKDVHDQQRANADSVLSLDKEATLYVTQKALIKREKLWVQKFFKAGIWTIGRKGVSGAPAGTGEFKQWNDAASTPIEDVRRGKREMLENTGFEPNKMIMGKKVYDDLLDHPDIVDRIKYGQTAPGTAVSNEATLAALFEIGKIEVMKAIENTAKEGQAPLHAFIGGRHALLVYVAPAPGLMTPTAGYTFSWTGHLGAGAKGGRIKTFRMENLASDRVEIEMAFDQKLVSQDLGYFFEDAVAA